MSETQCCIVGGGPAGIFLGLLLARGGVRVTLLEAHDDFDRAFRGDTVHPSTLEILDQLGLTQRLLSRPHGRLTRMTLRTADTTLVVSDFSSLRTAFPFIAILSQAEMLDLLAQEAAKAPGFELRFGCRAHDLMVEAPGTDAGRVCGVRYHEGGAERELRAALTVAADGRGSQLREAAGFHLQKTSPPMDVLWLVLPRRPEESALEATGFRIDRGRLIVVLGRADQWQLGYLILKGDIRAVREAGLPAFRADIAHLVPELADRVDTIRDWSDTHFLSVESGRIPRWHRPGFLAIGDAAHVMSPVGGVGINYAIQDAVATANLLTEPLLSGTLTERHLATVQRRRELPTRLVQLFQARVQRELVSRALRDRPFRLPLSARLALRVPGTRRAAAAFVAWGLRPERPA